LVRCTDISVEFLTPCGSGDDTSPDGRLATVGVPAGAEMDEVRIIGVVHRLASIIDAERELPADRRTSVSR
jgi:hypothetical protein